MTVQTIVAAHVFDGTGALTIENCFVQVENGTITAIGRKEDLGSRAIGAIDLGEATILPGLINMHTHLTFTGADNVLEAALDDSYETKGMRAVENARKARHSGVTTIRDCGTLTPIVFAIRKASAANMIDAPHVWASDDVLTSTDGHCYFFGIEADSIEDVRKAIRRHVKAGANFIKVMATGGGLPPIPSRSTHSSAGTRWLPWPTTPGGSVSGSQPTAMARRGSRTRLPPR